MVIGSVMPTPFPNASKTAQILRGVRTLGVVQRLGIWVRAGFVVASLGRVVVDLDEPTERLGVVNEGRTRRHPNPPGGTTPVVLVHTAMLGPWHALRPRSRSIS